MPELPVAASTTEPAPEPAARPTSRRGVLAAGASGLAGLLLGALGRPDRTEAAAGSPLIMGSTSNTAGTSSTSLTTASSGTALLVTQTGAGTALRGSATAVDGIAGFFTSANGPGVSGVTANKDKHAVYAGHNAASSGAGAALRAQGGQNSAVVATTAAAGVPTVKAINSAVGTDAGQGPAVHGLASAGAASDTHPGGSYYRGAGEFSGPNGVIGAASSESADGFGVFGVAAGNNGVGVMGQTTSALGVTFGVWGSSVSATDDSAGVRGASTSNTGIAYGVYGSTVSSTTGAAGVFGIATATTGETYGVAGQSDAAYGDATGVYGYASYAGPLSALTNGVWGLADSPTGTGVYGVATSATGAPYGVYGSAPSNGYALYSAGRAFVSLGLDVLGTLSKGGGSFKIDHPLDPANKYLYHSFVESPDMKNVYDGVATLDAAGEATVSMPDWFEALNRDFRYQLTAIGPIDRPLYVKSELRGGSFSIGGGTPGQRVSWQLTGIRRDAWANENRIPVEQAKKGAEKGKYLHPAAHGKPASAGIHQGRPAPKAPAKVRATTSRKQGQPG